MTDKIQKAKELATREHEGQNRRGGEPYITHPEAVANMVSDLGGTAVCLAWLHDVKEDSRKGFDFSMEFGKEIEEGTNLLARKKDETYYDFIKRIVNSGNRDVMYDKLKDLTHNMSTLEEGSMKDKYRFAFAMLWEAIENLPQVFEN